MGFLQRGFAWGNRRGFRVNPSLGKFILTELISMAFKGGGGRAEVTHTEITPTIVAIPTYAGGGLAASILTETNPTYEIRQGGGKGEVTLTETNPIIEAVVS